MGGDISASSMYGEGSVFRFSITTQRSLNPVSRPANSNLTPFKGADILVVDDNKTNLKILKTQLQNWKLQPLNCLSAEEALAVLADGKTFRLLITDMEMPEMDGATLAKTVKERYPELPIVMLSSIGDETKSKYPGLFSSILIKPVKQRQLCQAIEKALNPDAQPVNVTSSKQVLSADLAEKHPLSILVADDNAVNQKLIDRALNKLGYHADIVENGLQVLDKVEQQVYDVILMDIQMPEMDGLEATRHIRKNGTVQPYIIAMTANAMAEDKEICMEAGMNNYLSKPMKLAELVIVLEEAAKVVKAE